MTTPRYPKPALLAELPPGRHAVIEASAGTGKTYTLEHLVIELLLRDGARIEEVLVVTFTEKATCELKRRIREKLQALLDWTDVGEGLAPEACWTLDATARERLEAALGALDSATISTIHGFCQRILSEQAFASGRLFGEQQVDANAAFSVSFLQALREELARAPGTRALMEAWLESGRTVDGLQALLWECARERGVLGPPFDAQALVAAARAVPCDAAAREALSAELSAAKLNAAKLKGALERLESLEAALAGPGSDSDDALSLLSRLAAWREESGSGKEGAFDYVASRLSEKGTPLGTRAAMALRELRAATPSLEAALVQEVLPGVRARVARSKRELGQFDFDDMLLLVREGLTGPGGAALKAALRERYRFALVDEFQDTDEVQWDVFRTLFHESDAGNVLYLIGDPKQAIYGFRGADVHTYFAARDAVLRAGGVRVELQENFRSTAGVVDAYNRLLAHGATPPFFTGEVTYERAVTCGRADFVALEADGTPAAPVTLLRVVGEGELKADAVREALARQVARQIRALLGPGGLRLRTKDGERALLARDVFILTRGIEEGLALAPFLRAEGVPVAFFKQDGLFQSDEARDVLDLLAAVAAPEDRAARARAWMGPFFGLGVDGVEAAAEVPATHPLRERLLDWKALADARHYERLFSSVLDDSGVLRRELFLAASHRRLTNYLHLFELLLEETQRSRCTLPELVRLLQAYVEERRVPPGETGNVQRLEGEQDAVQVMTMHKSKGLEAPVVFLLGGLGVAPHKSHVPRVYRQDGRRCAWVGACDDAGVKQAWQREQDEENQRLLYVALTRAAARLYLPHLAPLSPDEAEALKAEGMQAPVGDYDVTGAWRIVNDRVAALRAEGRAADFAQAWVRCDAPSLPAGAPEEVLRGWAPPPALLAEGAPEDAGAEALAALRRDAAGFVVTSYSRMAAARAATDEGPEETLAGAPSAWTLLPPGALPPGVGTGLFVHELLERVDARALRAAPSLEAWVESCERWVRRIAERHGVGERHLPDAFARVWGAMRSPLGACGLPEGAAGAEVLLRELEFLYPIPEEAHPLLSRGAAAAGGRFTVERGCVRGFIDVVLEPVKGGRVFFADWKTDVLADYGPAALAAHVGAHYALQEQLYTLGVLRMLGVRDEAAYEARFGGSLYCFVRGMRPEAPGAGVHVARAPWRTVLAWEEALLRNRDWGFGTSAA